MPLMALLQTSFKRSMSFLCWDLRAACSTAGGVTTGDREGNVMPKKILLDFFGNLEANSGITNILAEETSWSMSVIVIDYQMVIL